MKAASEIPHPPGLAEVVFYRVCRLISVGISQAFFPGRVTGRENLPADGPYILAPVHRSYLDWLIVARVTKRRLRYIAKSELWKSKPVGRLLGALGAFPVNRSGADREALERCRAVLAGGEPLVMFPEGTRRTGPVVEDLREGVAYLAVRAGVPVVPVGIGGSERAMPRGSVIPRPRRVDVVVGPPMLPPVGVGRGSLGEWRDGSAAVTAGGAEPGTAPGPATGQGIGTTGPATGQGIDRTGPATGQGIDTPTGTATGERVGVTPGLATAGRPSRVSRRVLRDFSDAVAAGIQRAFDEAEAQLRR